MAIDSDTIYWPITIPTPLIGRSIRVNPRSWNTTMESLRSRVRRAHAAPLKVMSVSWNFTQDQYEAFEAFFIETIQQGSLPFAMETLEQDPDPLFVRAFLRELAFLNGTYKWTQSDNLFIVTAELEVDAESYEVIDNPFTEPPPPEYPEDDNNFETSCRDVWQISFTIPPTYVNGADVIQTGPTAAGPWYDYIAVVATEAQRAAGRVTVKINNSFGGTRFFKRTRNGATVSAPIQPQASVVAAPAGLLIEATTPSEFSFLESGPYVRPISYLENPLVNNSDVYIEPAARLDYVLIDQNFTGAIGNVVEGVGVEEGAELRWTTDGSSPSLDTPWPPPVKDGAQYNAFFRQTGFGGIVKARCMTGTCQSPILLYVIDRKVNMFENYWDVGATIFNGGAGCSEPITESNGHVTRSGADCDTYFGGSSNIPHLGKLNGCGNTQATENQYNDEGKKFIYYKVQINQQLPTYYGSRIWTFNYTTVWGYLLSSFDASAYDNRGFWDGVPQMYEFSRIVADDGKSHITLGATPDDIELGVHMAGAGGTLQAHCDTHLLWLQGQVPECIANPYNVELAIDRFWLWVTPYNDTWVGEAGEETVPPVPDPPLVLSGDRELWDDYLDTDDVTVGTYNGGVGWDGAWTFNQITSLYTTEEWDGYEDGEVTTEDALNLGEGWSADSTWTFRNYDDIDVHVIELWDDYEDGEMVPYTSSLVYVGGTGWNLVDALIPEFGMTGWFINHIPIGKEDWESYNDQVITGSTVLDYTDDDSWEGGSRWYFNP